ncbi:hypothetical protein WMF20_46825 [Sorangium sp. So ce834]|uniref:hypothetical protein n=1 Tax=Sorangium sp. So ce834 TaxID=3133321 RepID=UPI003F6003ED
MDQLQQFAETRLVVDVYRERLCKEGLMGRIVGFSEHVVLMSRIDDQCEHDGVTAVRPGDITRVRAQDRELLMIGKMLDSHEIAPPFDDVCLIELSAALTVLHRRYGAATVYVESLDSSMAFCGEPEELDDDFVVLRQWGSVRTLDKYKTLLRLDEITRVDGGTKYIQRLSKAHSLASQMEP